METTQEKKAEQNQGDREEQTVTVEDIGPGRKRLTIEVPAERIRKRIESSYSELGSDALIPGFRRGRAPRSLIEKRFGSSVRDEVRGRLLQDCYNQAVEEHKLQVIGQPDIKDADTLQLPDNGPLTFKVEVEVSPAVELPDLTGIEIKKPRLTVGPEDVQHEIQRFQRRFGRLVDAPDGKAQPDDYLHAEVAILPGGASGSGEPTAHYPDVHLLVPGDQDQGQGHVVGILVEDLGSRLVGRAVGDQVVIEMTGPAGHEDERIKGQPIAIKINLKKIERIEPAAVEALPAQLGLASVDDLQQRVTQILESRRDRQQQVAMHEQVCDWLLEHVQLDLPEGLTGRQTARLLRSEAMNLAYQGADEQEIEQKIAQMRQSTEDQARKQLKRFFILDQAAKNLQIEVSDGELNGRIALIAMQQDRRPEKLRQQMIRNGEIEHLYLQLREHKTLDKILQGAKISEVDAPAPSADQPAPAAAKKPRRAKAEGKKKSSE